jgi:predicted nucleic acid-binding protein
MYLIDTNVWLKLLLKQEKAEEVRRFFEKGRVHFCVKTYKDC